MDFVEALSQRETSPNVFEGNHPPESMGNALPIAYGGYAIASAASAAYRTLDSARFRLYSLQGSYLGPASTDRTLSCAVRVLRDTKSFATRLVEVGQVQPDGSLRVCLTAIADFHVREAASLLEYSVPQPESAPVEECPTTPEWVQRLLARGVLKQPQADFFREKFGLQARYFEQRMCAEGVNAQRLVGILKNLPTSQDGRRLTERTSVDWTRCKAPLRSPAEHAAAVTFLMDGALSFIPLTHSGLFLDDAAACSSLDFSLRLFEPELAFNEWHLREAKTVRGGNARTFSEGRLFRGGKLIASMTQQSILRPLPEKRANI